MATMDHDTDIAQIARAFDVPVWMIHGPMPPRWRRWVATLRHRLTRRW